MKQMIVATILCSALCISASLTEAKGVNLKPGKWETKTSMTASFMSQPPEIETECFTKKDVDEDALGLLGDENCTYSNKKVSRSHISFDMECKEEEISTKSHGDFNFNGNKFNGSMVMTVEMPANMPTLPNMPKGPMKTTIIMEGKLLGKCD